MAAAITDITPSYYKRTKIWKVVFDSSATNESVSAATAHLLDHPYVTGAPALTAGNVDAQILVATRYETSVGYGARPMSVLLSTTQATVRGEGGATGYVTLRRPHSQSR